MSETINLMSVASSLNFDNASETATEEMYQSHRIALKVPQGSDEIPQDQAFPLEYGLHELAGIDFQKKIVTLDKFFTPTGDLNDDLLYVQDYFSRYSGKRAQ